MSRMGELLELFVAWRQDIDSVPFERPASDIDAALAAWDKEGAA